MSVASPTIRTVDNTAGRVAPRTSRNRRPTYALLVTLLGLALAVSGAPSPLYATYAREWHFSPLTLTIVFAVYAVAALAALLIAGPLTDRFGRKPALLMSAAGMITGLVVFMTASDVTALIVARAVHGAAIGTAIVAAGAGLLDIRPGAGAKAGRDSGIVFSVGMAVGILGCAVLADLAPNPLVTPYFILSIITAVVLVGLAAVPETHEGRGGTRLRLARPRFPDAIRADFRFAALGAMASWVVLGMYLSLFPQLAAAETGIDDLVFGSGVVASMTLASAATQWLGGPMDPRRMAVIGDIGTAVVLLLSIPLVLSGNPILIFAVSALLGAFFGMAFSGSVRHLSHVIPPAHRGSVMSAFYILNYLAMAVPAVLAGAAATLWSLPSTYAWFAAVVALVCAVAAVLGRRAAARS